VHGVQIAASFSAANVPASHVEHDVAPCEDVPVYEDVPASHASGSTVAALPHANPAGHSSHEPPAAALYSPAGHGTAIEIFDGSHSVPAGHCEHADCFPSKKHLTVVPTLSNPAPLFATAPQPVRTPSACPFVSHTIPIVPVGSTDGVHVNVMVASFGSGITHVAACSLKKLKPPSSYVHVAAIFDPSKS
jgi:hypothetical protein